LQSKRYLPPTTVRQVVDNKGNDISSTLRHEIINQLLISVDAATAKDVVRSQTGELKNMLDSAERLADNQKPHLIARAHKQAMRTIEPEIERLKALKAHNPNVREEEIAFFEDQHKVINHALDTAALHLDAVRIIVAT
jgi:ATP-dependent helicase HepA